MRLTGTKCHNQVPKRIKILFNFNNPRHFQFNGDFKLVHFNCNDAKGKQRIRYYLPKLIQDTEVHILRKTLDLSIIAFKSYIKYYFLSKYNDTPCEDLNCYACNSMLYHFALTQQID